MAANLYKQKDANMRKTWVLLTLFFVLIIVVGWILSVIFQSSVILIVSLIFSVVMSFTSYWWSDKLVLKMTHAHEAKREEYKELHRIVENLAIAAGLPKPRIYVVEDAAMNAFATGRNANHAVVAITIGLLSRLNRAELEGVLAHELSHIGNRDMLISTVVVVLVGMIVFAADIMFRGFFYGSLFTGGNRRDHGGAVTMLMGVVVLGIAAFFATLLRLSISRKREYLADSSGALLTRYPEGLAGALEKIGQDEHRLRAANNATAHLFLANPFRREEGKSWFNKLFLTHPPLDDRIARLRAKEE